jgi:hypothetical protein
VDVQDVARLHVGALLLSDVQNERLFAFATPFNVNTVLETLRKVFPNNTFVENQEGVWDDLTKAPTERAEEVLKMLKVDEWTSEEESWLRMKDLFLGECF